MRIRSGLVVILAGLAMASPSLAQDRPPSSQSLRDPSGCDRGRGLNPTRAEAATAPERASADGTAPGNAGSTGWSGGTGGSQIGTNTSGAVRTSPTWQPPTARGLDPIAAPIRTASDC